MKRYAITMAIRTACLLAMVLVTPYSWYTWIFAVGAVFLPYIAVVFANVGVDSKAVHAVTPERTLDASTPSATTDAAEAPPAVIRIEESRKPRPDA